MSLYYYPSHLYKHDVAKREHIFTKSVALIDCACADIIDASGAGALEGKKYGGLHRWGHSDGTLRYL